MNRMGVNLNLITGILIIRTPTLLIILYSGTSYKEGGGGYSGRSITAREIEDRLSVKYKAPLPNS